MRNRGIIDGVIRFGRSILRADRRAAELTPTFIDPLEGRVLLSSFLCPLSGFLNSQLQSLTNNIGTMAANTPIPVSGQTIGQICGVTNLFAGFNPVLTNALCNTYGDGPVEDLRTAIFNAMQPYLFDRNGVGGVERTDVEIPVFNIATQDVRVVFSMDYTAAPLNCSLGTALPSLPFKINSGGIIVTPGFHYDNFTFGLNAGTPYFDASPTNELSIRLSAKLDRTQPVTGSMGFLKITATDAAPIGQPATTGIENGVMTLDVINSGGVPTPAFNSLRFTAQTKFDLNVRTADVGAAQGKLHVPDARFRFRMNWDFVNANPAAGFSSWGLPPQVFFDNVELNLGGFLNHEMLPIAKDLQKITRQLQPVFDVLKARVPILSELSELVGGGEINLIKLNNVISQTGIIPTGIQNLLNLTLKLAEVGDALNQIDLNNGPVVNNAWIPMGSFDLSPNAPLQSLPPSLFSATVANWNNLAIASGTSIDLNFVKNWIAANVTAPLGNQIVGLIDVLNGNDAQDGAWIKYPILDDPKQGLYKLILGQGANVDLVRATFRLQNTPLNLQFDLPTPIDVFDIRLTFNINPDIYVRGGFDTFGLRQSVTDPTPDIGDIRNGLWLDPTSHARVQGFGGLGPVFGTGVLEFTLQGGVTADFRADPVPEIISALPDPSKIRVFIDLQNSPKLLVITGSVDIALRLGVRIGVDTPLGFVGIEPSYDYGLVDLLRLEEYVPNPFYLAPSPIASLDPNTKVLTLNLGSLARRQARGIEVNQINEQYRISRISDNGESTGSQDLLVSAFGVTGSYAGVTQIIADGDDGNDIIEIAADVTVPASITGGTGDDKLSYLGSGSATIRGGDGADQLFGGTGPISLFGDAGNDQLTGGPGNGQNNVLDGGADDDRLLAGPGPATLIGGTGNDQLIGNTHPDSIDGGDGNDSIYGNLGNDTIVGGIGADVIDSGGGGRCGRRRGGE